MAQRGPPAWITEVREAAEAGELLNPLTLIGDLQDHVPCPEFLQVLAAQGRLARSMGEYRWCQRAQSILIRYEGWRHEDACAVVPAPDPGQNLPAGAYPPKVDWSHKSLYWDRPEKEPSAAPQHPAASSPTHMAAPPASPGRAPQPARTRSWAEVAAPQHPAASSPTHMAAPPASLGRPPQHARTRSWAGVAAPQRSAATSPAHEATPPASLGRAPQRSPTRSGGEVTATWIPPSSVLFRAVPQRSPAAPQARMVRKTCTPTPLGRTPQPAPARSLPKTATTPASLGRIPQSAPNRSMPRTAATPPPPGRTAQPEPARSRAQPPVASTSQARIFHHAPSVAPGAACGMQDSGGVAQNAPSGGRATAHEAHTTAARAPRDRHCAKPKPPQYRRSARKRAGEGRDEGPQRKTHCSLCPIPGCGMRDSHLRRHMYRLHLPECLRPTLPGEPARPDLLLQRTGVLRRLAELTLGSPRIQGLVEYLDTEWRGPVGEVAPDLQTEIEEFAATKGWPCPLPISLQPLSSPAALLHWRPLSFILANLSPENRGEFRRFTAALPTSRRKDGGHTAPSRPRGAKTPPAAGKAPASASAPSATRTQAPAKSPQAPAKLPKTPLDKRPVAGHTDGPAGAAPARSAPAAPAAFDAHFHLDRLERRVPAKGLEAIRAEPGPPPAFPVTIIGGVFELLRPRPIPRGPFPPGQTMEGRGGHPPHQGAQR